MYIRSYHDMVDHRTVICSEVKLKKDGSKYKLTQDQTKKIKRRLERALAGAPLSSDDDSDIDDELPLRLPGSERPVGKVER